MFNVKPITFLYTVLIVLLLATFVSNVGCGYRETARNHCSLGAQLCDTLLGSNTWELDNRVQANEQNIANIHAEITSLQSMIQLLISETKDKTSEILQLTTLLTTIQMTVSGNQAFVDTATADLNAQISELRSDIDYEQTRINDLVGDVAELQLQDGIIEFIYPCGDRPNIYDEVLMRTKSGKLVVYFENGSNRFLSVLTAGAYRTTDQAPQCLFTVDASGNLTSASR